MRTQTTYQVTIDGKKTKIAGSVKDRSLLCFWYWIKHPVCGGWVEFDIRWFGQIDQLAWMLQFGGTVDQQLAVAATHIQQFSNVMDTIKGKQP